MQGCLNLKLLQFIYFNNENANGYYSGSHNVFNGQDEFIFETMKKYIQKLEEDIISLKQVITNLKNQ